MRRHSQYPLRVAPKDVSIPRGHSLGRAAPPSPRLRPERVALLFWSYASQPRLHTPRDRPGMQARVSDRAANAKPRQRRWVTRWVACCEPTNEERVALERRLGCESRWLLLGVLSWVCSCVWLSGGSRACSPVCSRVAPESRDGSCVCSWVCSRMAATRALDWLLGVLLGIALGMAPGCALGSVYSS